MKTRFTLRTGLTGLLIALIAAGTPVFAHNGKAHAGEAADSTAAAVASYPVSTCVVSGDKLEAGDMGPIIDYIHKEDGKPDRLVRLCCKGCVKDFKKDPAKYLKMIDDAAAAKAKGEKLATPAPTGHGTH